MDTIRGTVTNVIDGDTFDMKVTHHGVNNQFEYNNSERIRISKIDAAELNTIQGLRDKVKLEKAILHKEIRVYVEARDMYHRVVGRVVFI